MPGTSLTFATARSKSGCFLPSRQMRKRRPKIASPSCRHVKRIFFFCRLHFSDGSFLSLRPVTSVAMAPPFLHPRPPPLSPLAYLSFYLSPSPSLTNRDNSAGLIAPSGLRDGINTFFSQNGSRRPRRILNGAPGCVGCRLSRRCFV